ncbi:hypothetical protein Tco_1010865 [Tanacetum coccineum]
MILALQIPWVSLEAIRAVESSLGSCGIANLAILQLGKIVEGEGKVYPSGGLGCRVKGRKLAHKDNDNDKINIKQPSRDISVIPSPNVIDTDVDAYAQGSNNLLETSHDTISIDTVYPGVWMRRIDFLYSFRHSDASTTHILARKRNMEDHTEQILGSV